MIKKRKGSTTLTGVWQKILLTAKPAIHETKVQDEVLPKSNETKIESIGLPGSKWILGSSSGANRDIAKAYDEPPKYPDS